MEIWASPLARKWIVACVNHGPAEGLRLVKMYVVIEAEVGNEASLLRGGKEI